MQAFSEFAFVLIFGMFIVLSLSLGYVGARIQIRGWDYTSRDPAQQMQIRGESIWQITQLPGFLLWYLYSIVYLENLVAFVAGCIVIPISAIIGMGLGSTGLEEIPVHTFDYNYKIKPKVSKKRIYQFDRILPPKKKGVHFDRTLPNKKQGRRYEYWRGYGRYN